MNAFTGPPGPISRAKSLGGDILEPLEIRALVLWLLKEKKLRAVDARVYYAVVEMLMRRRGAPTTANPIYTLREVAVLLGHDEHDRRAHDSIARSLRRLVPLGLVRRWPLSIPRSLEDLWPPVELVETGALEAVEALCDALKAQGGLLLPLPRRALRAVVGGPTSKGLLMVYLVALARTLRRSDRMNRYGGRVSVPLVQELTGLKERQVRAHRQRLLGAGLFLEPLLPAHELRAEHWRRQHHGSFLLPPPDLPTKPKLHPPRPRTAPPKNPDPSSTPRSSARAQGSTEHGRRASLPPPSCAALRLEDLIDPERFTLIMREVRQRYPEVEMLRAWALRSYVLRLWRAGQLRSPLGVWRWRINAVLDLSLHDAWERVEDWSIAAADWNEAQDEMCALGLDSDPMT